VKCFFVFVPLSVNWLLSASIEVVLL